MPRQTVAAEIYPVRPTVRMLSLLRRKSKETEGVFKNNVVLLHIMEMYVDRWACLGHGENITQDGQQKNKVDFILLVIRRPQYPQDR
jgi:hypothetical protein